MSKVQDAIDKREAAKGKPAAKPKKTTSVKAAPKKADA